MAKPIGNVFKGIGKLFGAGGGGPSATDVPPPPPITPREVVRSASKDKVIMENMQAKANSPRKTRGVGEATTVKRSMLGAKKAAKSSDA